jgi:hypothetical protein
MIIFTCANSEVAIRNDGKAYKNFSFRSVIQDTVTKAKELGYTPVVYDMGNLGVGERFILNNVTTNALFKPLIVKHCMETNEGDIFVYIDGDAQLCNAIDEVTEGDYDIGVTLRAFSEINNEWHRQNFEWTKFLNAGVMIFKRTEATKQFIDIWHKLTEKVGDDQVALNKLACPNEYPEAGSTLEIGGVRFKFFPCQQYNYYYFEDNLEDNIKILHFKGIVRHFYPFNWRKRLYCKIVVPARNRTKEILKKILPSKSSGNK